MKNSNNSTDLAKLEWYDYALSNVKSNSKMSNPLQEIGISADVLEEGSNLLSNARVAYNATNSTKKKRAEAYDALVKASQSLEEHYRIDKNKAQIAFLSNKPVQEKLDLNRGIPKNRLQQFEMSKTFYIALSENPEFLEPLEKIGLGAENVKTKLELIAKVEKAKANYMLEKGLSQNATKVKNNAIDIISKWMSRFFSISKRAFKEEPQMMEALGFVVKS